MRYLGSPASSDSADPMLLGKGGKLADTKVTHKAESIVRVANAILMVESKRILMYYLCIVSS